MLCRGDASVSKKNKVTSFYFTSFLKSPQNLRGRAGGRPAGPGRVSYSDSHKQQTTAPARCQSLHELNCLHACRCFGAVT